MLLPENFTSIMWTFPTANGSQTLWWQDTATVRHNFERKFEDEDDYSVLLHYDGDNALVETVGVDRPLNRWSFVAVINSAGGSGPRIFHGLEDKPPIEAAYSLRDAGVGAFQAATGAFLVGNAGVGGDSFVGLIHNVMVFTRTLDRREIDYIWRTGKPLPGLGIWSEYGFSGAARQQDRSGLNNGGVVTGARASAHAPLTPAKHAYSRYVDVLGASAPPRRTLMGVGV